MVRGSDATFDGEKLQKIGSFHHWTSGEILNFLVVPFPTLPCLPGPKRKFSSMFREWFLHRNFLKVCLDWFG